MQKAMTLAEMAQERWLREGRTEGRTEGRIEGRIEVLERLLRRHFGELSPATQERLKSGTLDELDAWIDRAFDATSLDEVFES